jgi:3-hydroxybutyryl-CoA dehydratase
VRFSDLTPGYEFPSTAVALDAATVQRYLAATEDDNALYWRDGAIAMVPPLAVAALAFRGIAQELALEPGSLHTGQELEFRRPVAVGERLTTAARVTASSKRRGFTALSVEVAATDPDGEIPLLGRMMLMVAGAEGASGSITERGDAAGLSAAFEAAPSIDRVEYPPLQGSTLVPGLALGPLERTVTQERIDQYAEASGDYNPIHIDRAFAAASPFGGTVAHGMLLLSYLSTLLTRSFGHAWPNSGRLKVKFRNPAPAGTAVTAQGQVERLEDGHGVQYALCAVRLDGAGGESLITGEARVGMSR